MLLTIATQQYDLSHRVLLMAILNVTPDSFSDGGKFTKPDAVKTLIDEAIRNKVDIIDVGGESSRPGAAEVNIQEELDRTTPVIELIKQHCDIHVSIDTKKSDVAKAALNAGAKIINDITAGTFDHQMIPLAAEQQVPIVLMHMQGTPQTMQNAPGYDDVVKDIKAYLKDRIEAARSAGIKEVIIDPGIGFGKTVDHNYKLINDLTSFKDLGCPILIGASRKSFLAGENKLSPEQREEATIVVHSQAVLNGARIVRTHDIEKGRRMIESCEMLLRS